MNDGLLWELEELEEKQRLEAMSWAPNLMSIIAGTLRDHGLDASVENDKLVCRGFGVWGCEPRNASLVLKLDIRNSKKYPER